MTEINNKLNFVFEKDKIHTNALKSLREAKMNELMCENVSVRVDSKTILSVKKEKFDGLGKDEIIRRYKFSRRLRYW